MVLGHGLILVSKVMKLHHTQGDSVRGEGCVPAPACCPDGGPWERGEHQCAQGCGPVCGMVIFGGCAGVGRRPGAVHGGRVVVAQSQWLGPVRDRRPGAFCAFALRRGNRVSLGMTNSDTEGEHWARWTPRLAASSYWAAALPPLGASRWLAGECPGRLRRIGVLLRRQAASRWSTTVFMKARAPAATTFGVRLLNDVRTAMRLPLPRLSATTVTAALTGAALAAACMGAAAVSASAAPAPVATVLTAPAAPVLSAATPSDRLSDRLAPGQSLAPGQWLLSPDRSHGLAFQTDGNLVAYGANYRVLWHSGTYANPGARFTLQPDGNAVIYAASGAVLWHSGTYISAGASLRVQDDGNVVITGPGGQVAFYTGWDRTGLYPGEQLLAGQRVTSAGGRYSLNLQADGNVVVRASSGRPLFFTGSYGATRLAFQADGNLVAYAGDGSVLFATGTTGARSRLVVQDDGNVVIYRRDGGPAWYSGWDAGQSADAPRGGVQVR
ncbi:hypothetical protein F1641_10645 [Quadrisphaera sp. INWT6]|nr:hypothetical protein [Quadrisphaera sp. INWT6]